VTVDIIVDSPLERAKKIVNFFFSSSSSFLTEPLIKEKRKNG